MTSATPTGVLRGDGAVLAAEPQASPADPTGTPLKVALLGCGVVGSSVARLLVEHSGDLALAGVERGEPDAAGGLHGAGVPVAQLDVRVEATGLGHEQRRWTRV